VLESEESEKLNASVHAWLETFMQRVDDRSYYRIRLTRYVARKRPPTPQPAGTGATIARLSR
jgi:hypothetical protein